jgi:hypothetical protein
MLPNAKINCVFILRPRLCWLSICRQTHLAGTKENLPLCRSFLVLRFDPNTENPDHDEGEREGEQENIIQYHTSVKFFVYHRFLREQHSRLLCCQELCENIRPWAPLQITDSLPGPIVAIVDRNSSYQSSCVNSGCCAVHGHRARRPQNASRRAEKTEKKLSLG